MKKVLVIVDMQKDFIYGALSTKEARKIIQKIAAYANDFEGDIILTADTHYADYLNTQEGKNLPVIHCRKDTEGWEFIDELKLLLEKRNVKIFEKNGFGSPELAAYLKVNRYEEAEFCGVCTGICVISNVLTAKAFSPELRIRVLSDMCACVTQESHRTALDAMKTCQVEIA